MNNITKYNIKTFSISILGLVLMLCVLSYLIAPHTESFQLDSVNPLEILIGFVFFMSFGLGLPLWLSIITTIVILSIIVMIFTKLVRKIVK